MCDTCQDCSCDNITLPVAIGATGATGPAGAAGADGQPGTVILFNNTVMATTTSNVVADLTGMTYTLPLAQLANDGSKLKLNAYFTLHSATGAVNPVGTGDIQVYFGGLNIAVYPTLFYINKGNTMASIEVVFMRKDNLTLYAECSKKEGLVENGFLSSSGQTLYLEKNIVANDLDTLSNIIKLRGNTTAGGAVDVLKCHYMSIEFLNKI